MIDVLFRGKEVSSGDWATGNYCKAELLDGTGYEHFIIEICAKGVTHKVSDETVGQYTGLRDMNGNMAWEGDVTEDRDGRRWVIFRGPGGFGVCRTFQYKTEFRVQFFEELAGLQNSSYFMRNHEVIGNIYDNPGLLGG